MPVRFGEVLREFRLRAVWTQEALAARAGVSAHAVSVLEAGRRRPRLSTMVRLADALELDADDRDRLIASAGTPSSAGAGATQSPQPDPAPPPASAGDPVPRMLPGTVADFTGRAGELGQLVDLVRTERVRGRAAVVVSAVDGMAGIGKTALVIHAAHAVADDFPDGQLYVDLQGHTPGRGPLEPGASLARLLRAVGAPDSQLSAGTDDLARLWRSRVAGRRLLIVLDNALDAGQVRPLLPGEGPSLVLITSRRRLVDLEGAESMSMCTMPPVDAVSLFRRIVGAQRVAGQHDAVAEVVLRCGYLPLAIRIAAARLRHRASWRVADLVDRLDRVVTADADPAASQVTAAFTMSYQRLRPAQQRMFRLLGLVPGTDLDTAAAAALAGLPADTAEVLLEDLLDHHLLEQHTPGRYTFHDLLREHARRAALRTDDASARTAALRGLFDHYLRTAATAVDVLYPHHEHHVDPPLGQDDLPVPPFDDATARAWIGRELSNLVACAELAEATGLPGHTRDLAAVLCRYLMQRPHPAEALALHTAEVSAARALADPTAEVNALTNLSQAHKQNGNFPDAIEHMRTALALARRVGDAAGERHALAAFGALSLSMGELGDTVTYSRDALRASRAAGDHGPQGDILNQLGTAHCRQGRYQEAIDAYQQSIALARELGDQVAEARALCNIASVHGMMGDYPQTLHHLREALGHARAAEDLMGEAVILANIGVAQQRLGHLTDAIDHLEQSRTIAEGIGDVLGQARVTIVIGATHIRLGQHQQARLHLENALTNARVLGERNLHTLALNRLGDLARVTGDPDTAQQHHQQARVLAADIGNRFEHARARAGIGDALSDLGRPDEAREHWTEALQQYRELGVPEAADVEHRLSTGEVPAP
ncbi:ATP-binding protein [Solihabitans fulvus]|uniref:ATP-binding protein n=1 Tax=Solihabitans fulvus TaxID=1892852 RepID=UPI001CB762C9|nr:helix-turn-helix domain-containing protein [Solihabitans fulvus]